MKRRVVMFDIDGVLADFLGHYRATEAALGMEQTYESRWDAYWNQDVWACIKTRPDWWVKVPSLASRDEFARIADMTYAHDVYFVTNRSGVDVKLQTERWLRMRGVLSPTVLLVGRRAKARAAKTLQADFAIDDKAGNAIVVSWNEYPATKSFLLDTAYNRGFNPDDVGGSVHRVKTVNEFLDEVDR